MPANGRRALIRRLKVKHVRNLEVCDGFAMVELTNLWVRYCFEEYQRSHDCPHDQSLTILLNCAFKYSHAPPNDVSVNDGPHIRRWSHKIII